MSSQIITQGSSAVDLDKLDLIADVQFNEPMTSAALNRKFFGIMPEGIYRGFNVVPAGGLTVSIGDDPVNVAVVNVDGFMLNVRGRRPVKLEVPVGREVYAIIEANYAVGRQTTQTNMNASIKAADLRIINPNELRKNHVIVFTANLPVGTTEITKENIQTHKRQQSTILDETADKLIKAMDAHCADADAHPQYAKKHSPALTGVPTAPTPPEAAKGEEIATAAFVLARIAHMIGSAPDVMDTLQEIAAALNNNPNFANEILLQLAGKLSKEANGSDIPDKAKFLANIGLTAIINQANNALLRTGGHLTGDVIFDTHSRLCWDRNTDMASIYFKNDADADTDSYMAFETADNGNEYFRWLHRWSGGAKIDEWMSLKADGLRVLGGLVYSDKRKPTALDVGACRAFHGAVGTGGGNWTTPEFIAWLESQGAFANPYWMCKCSWDYAGNKLITDTGCGLLQLAGAVIEVMGIRTAMTIRVTTPTTTSGGTPNAQFTYINHGPAYLPGWRRDYNTASRPSPAELNVYAKGETDARYYLRSDSDGRYYSKWEADGRYVSKAMLGNYATKAEVGGGVVKDIRLGSVELDGRDERIPYVITASYQEVARRVHQKGGSHVEYRSVQKRRPIQKLVNGVWYNVGAA